MSGTGTSIPTTNVDMNSIRSTLMSVASTPYALDQFYLGGKYVSPYMVNPNLIPSSGEISLGSFRSAVGPRLYVNAFTPTSLYSNASSYWPVFNTTSNYIEFSPNGKFLKLNSLVMNLSSSTTIFNVRFTSNSTNANRIFDTGSEGGDFYSVIWQSNKIRFLVRNNGSVVCDLFSASTLTLNTDYRIACRISSSVASIWMNGTQNASVTVSATPTNRTVTARIGLDEYQNPDGSAVFPTIPFTGRLYNLSFFNVALSSL